MATSKTTTARPARAEGEWSSEPAFFERALDAKRTVKACIATSPDGSKFVSIREWRNKADGTPYYTKNAVLVPLGADGDKLREVFVAALQAQPEPAKKAAPPAKKAPKKVAA